jgi:hypothetical protein
MEHVPPQKYSATIYMWYAEIGVVRLNLADELTYRTLPAALQTRSERFVAADHG